MTKVRLRKAQDILLLATKEELFYCCRCQKNLPFSKIDAKGICFNCNSFKDWLVDFKKVVKEEKNPREEWRKLWL